MNTRVYSIIALLIALTLAFFLVKSIKFEIDETKRISKSEAIVIEKLKLIREAQVTYQEVNSRYTNNWDTLINFIEHGKYYVTKRSEHIIELAYGADSIVVTIDTIDVIPAKDYIFIKNHDIFIADNGDFLKFFVKKGQKIRKGQKLYSMVSSITGKKVNQMSKVGGVIVSLENIATNTTMNKGDLLLQVREEKFNPNTDISQLAIIPLTNPAVKFDLFADKIEKNRLLVNVVEVRDTKPVDPKRSEENEANNAKPLRFGSRTEVTTAGNWE
ncbi:MAG: hypothetical protein L3J29_11950 [Cyclobacteriaceae bacterium]|nr:hypothetical protein [Cyclobacteriaceae bacterium]